ncbi:hypothetical protein GLOTRDRAFT_129617 [Gloeophyllum trabeum ATCC 11539]|uniref:Uncharacterized protein n=1 Tax=Gloeophyllum trabeum (strain ATCC 11539 / FP-39264 / Madison 617) TaxID=670483 RepID=S7Q745_GLOTA|nr:uncharacterized protein GLOTRDRAFT_129617 [Gloeophyllum trabeum ATCC 11539]EPQ55342.1 hypothetical protein GLOTRDRAFT_129617 [Gloeophyllum trabeum ATCC 11539]
MDKTKSQQTHTNAVRPSLSLDISPEPTHQVRDRGLNATAPKSEYGVVAGRPLETTSTNMFATVAPMWQPISPVELGLFDTNSCHDDPSPLILEGVFTLPIPSPQAAAAPSSSLFPTDPVWDSPPTSRRSSSNFADESSFSSLSDEESLASPLATATTLQTRGYLLDIESESSGDTSRARSTRASFLGGKSEESPTQEPSPNTALPGQASHCPSPSKGHTVSLPPSPVLPSFPKGHRRLYTSPAGPSSSVRGSLPNIRPLAVPAGKSKVSRRVSSPPPPSPTDPVGQEMLGTVNTLLADFLLPYKLRAQSLS